jgi:hypothetical protein
MCYDVSAQPVLPPVDGCVTRTNLAPVAHGSRGFFMSGATKRTVPQIMTDYRSWLAQIGVSTSHPLAFLVVGVYVAVWSYLISALSAGKALVR